MFDSEVNEEVDQKVTDEIWFRLEKELGREPTFDEVIAELEKMHGDGGLIE